MLSKLYQKLLKAITLLFAVLSGFSLILSTNSIHQVGCFVLFSLWFAIGLSIA